MTSLIPSALKAGSTVTMYLPDGSVKQTQTQELKDRLMFNSIIDPIVSALCQVHGLNYKLDEVTTNNNGAKVANVVLDKKGEFLLVPEGDIHVTLKCSLLAKSLLCNKLDKMGMDTQQKKDQVVKHILENCFYDDVEVVDIDNLSKLLALCTMQAIQ